MPKLHIVSGICFFSFKSQPHIISTWRCEVFIHSKSTLSLSNFFHRFGNCFLEIVSSFFSSLAKCVPKCEELEERVTRMDNMITRRFSQHLIKGRRQVVFHFFWFYWILIYQIIIQLFKYTV